MGIIKVENIRVFAYHGCLKEETKIGSDYRVDLKVKANLQESAKTDKLSDTRLGCFYCFGKLAYHI